MKNFRKELGKLLLDEKEQIKKTQTSSTIAKVILIFGIAVAIITTALCVYTYIDNIAYRKKWQEYDDCGI